MVVEDLPNAHLDGMDERSEMRIVQKKITFWWLNGVRRCRRDSWDLRHCVSMMRLHVGDEGT